MFFVIAVFEYFDEFLELANFYYNQSAKSLKTSLFFRLCITCE